MAGCENSKYSASLAGFRHVAQRLERRLDTAEVGGSIPLVPTTVLRVGVRLDLANRFGHHFGHHFGTQDENRSHEPRP